MKFFWLKPESGEARPLFDPLPLVFGRWRGPKRVGQGRNRADAGIVQPRISIFTFIVVLEETYFRG